MRQTWLPSGGGPRGWPRCVQRRAAQGRGVRDDSMEKSQIVQFLEAVDAELAKHARQGERLELHLLGRAALIVRYGLSLATKDVDMVTRTDAPDLEAKAFELFGKGTPNASRWGLYLEGVPAGLPPVPG